MGDCSYAQRIGAYYDGEVGEEERRQIERHLQQCEECSAALERLRALSAFLGRARVPELSEGALSRFHSAASGAAERVVFRTARSFAAAAAVLLVVCLGWLWQTGSKESAHYAQAVPEWERVAVMQEADVSGEVSSEIQMAQWIVADLSWENARE